MSSVCLLITSPPTSPEGRQALHLAEALLEALGALALCVLQDAVVLAGRKQPHDTRQAMERLVARGAAVFVLHEDLALRGLVSAELLEGVRAVDYREIVDLLADGHARVIGAL